MAFPSYTKNWHNTTYDAISPTRPELSAAGKTIFVTGGAGRGTGIAITKSFAKAGASKIAISGRTEKSLVAAKEEIEKAFPKTKVVPFVADVLDAKAMNDAFESLCKVDVLVHNAGAMTDLVPLATADLQDWWKAMEVNVKGSLIVTRAFVKVAAPDASIINTVTAAAHLPPFPDYSSYQVSKVAQNKFFEAVQAEHPELYVYSLHPGVIKSDMSDRTTAHGLALPWDDSSLPGDISVWLSSPEARFLKGKTIWSNYDVDDLKAQADKLTASPNLTIGLVGMFEAGHTST